MPSFKPVLEDGEIVAIRLRGRRFSCEEETGEVIVPEQLLSGVRLSEIPQGVIVEPATSVSRTSKLHRLKGRFSMRITALASPNLRKLRKVF
jgi:hypothetical protein